MIRFLRLERIKTGSWMTWELTEELPLETANDLRFLDCLIDTLCPGWEWVTASLENPDKVKI